MPPSKQISKASVGGINRHRSFPECGPSIFPRWRLGISRGLDRGFLSGRTAAARLLWRRVDERRRTCVLRHECGVLAESVARSFDLDDDCMLQQSVEQRGGDGWIAERLAPFGEAAVRGDDHRILLVARVDELEEQIAAAWHDREVSDLVNNEQ
jgi:hypothetical protein